jgi:hypothetical protein
VRWRFGLSSAGAACCAARTRTHAGRPHVRHLPRSGQVARRLCAGPVGSASAPHHNPCCTHSTRCSCTRTHLVHAAHTHTHSTCKHTHTHTHTSRRAVAAHRLDLSSGPVVLTAGASSGRFYTLELLDMYTEVFGNPCVRWRGPGRAPAVLAGAFKRQVDVTLSAPHALHRPSHTHTRTHTPHATAPQGHHTDGRPGQQVCGAALRLGPDQAAGRLAGARARHHGVADAAAAPRAAHAARARLSCPSLLAGACAARRTRRTRRAGLTIPLLAGACAAPALHAGAAAQRDRLPVLQHHHRVGHWAHGRQRAERPAGCTSE